MDAYLGRIDSDKLTVLGQHRLIFDDQRLAFVGDSGAELSLEEVENHYLGWLGHRGARSEETSRSRSFLRSVPLLVCWFRSRAEYMLRRRGTPSPTWRSG
jgi:hypothetical protein